MKALIFFISLFYALISSAQRTHPFEDKVQSIEKRHNSYSHPFLFIGSSTIERWKNLEKRYSSFQALNYGISGSQVSDLIHFKERLILKSVPRGIVIYSGDNDLASGKSPDEVAQDYKKLILGIRSQQYQTIFLLGVKQSPKRIENRFKIIQLNNKLQDLAFYFQDVIFIDFNPQILDCNGFPDGRYFAPDLLHLNEFGYDILERTLSKEFGLHPEIR